MSMHRSYCKLVRNVCLTLSALTTSNSPVDAKSWLSMLALVMAIRGLWILENDLRSFVFMFSIFILACVSASTDTRSPRSPLSETLQHPDDEL